jgi:hypothetical protein
MRCGRLAALFGGLGAVACTLIDSLDDISGGAEPVAPPSEDGGPVDASVVDRDSGELDASATDPSGLRVGICLLERFTGTDPAKAVRFYAVLDITADTIDARMRPLRGWDKEAGQPKPPETISLAQTIGGEVKASSPIEDGGYSLRFSNVNIPGEANPTFGVPATIKTMTFVGTMVRDRRANLCVNVTGQISSPIDAGLDPKENRCVLVPVEENDPLPQVVADTFLCQ